MAKRGARTKALGLLLASGAVLAGVGACGDGSGAGAGSATPTSSASAPNEPGSHATRSAAVADLDLWLERLESTHPDPFHAVDRDDFVAALDDLAAALPTMTPAQSVVGVMRVAGLLSHERDGHQFAMLQDDRAWPVLPLQVYELAEGVVVTAARDPYEDLAGSTIVAVNDHPIAEVLDALDPLVPRDGPATLPTFRPGFLLRTVVLRGLGLIPDVDDAAVSLTVATDGQERRVDVAPITLSQHVAWAGDFGVLRLPPLGGVDYLQPTTGPLAWSYLEAAHTLYVHETEVRSATSVLDEVRGRADQLDVERFVLDLRQNPGGDNHNNPAVVGLLVHVESARPDVPIVVITDRVTFSAAANLATDIEQATDAVFVGEPMGGGLNFWDDVTFLDLDALPVPMSVGISTKYWQKAGADDPRLTIRPDVAVPMSWADLARGRDAALDAALAVDPQQLPVD